MKGCLAAFVFMLMLAAITLLFAVCLSMCSCRGKGKDVKTGVYLDSVYSPLEAPLRIKNDSVDNYSGYNLNLLNKNDSIIIKQPGISHTEWIYPLGNGDSLRYGYAKITRGGFATIGFRTDTGFVVTDTIVPKDSPLFRKGEIYYFDTTLRVLKGIKDDSKY